MSYMHSSLVFSSVKLFRFNSFDSKRIRVKQHSVNVFGSKNFDAEGASHRKFVGGLLYKADGVRAVSFLGTERGPRHSEQNHFHENNACLIMRYHEETGYRAEAGLVKLYVKWPV